MSAAAPRHLYTLGEILVVMLAEGGGNLAAAATFRRRFAGSEFNVAAAFHRLGHGSTMLTRLGSDPLGDAAAAETQRLGIDSAIVWSDRPNGILIRTPAGERGAEAIHLRSGSAAAELCPDDVDASWPQGVDAVFLTGITATRSAVSRDAVAHVAELARSSGGLVVVDPNFRPAVGGRADFAQALSPLRGCIDVAIGDEDELRLLSNADDPRVALLNDGCRLVVTKRGARGAQVTDGVSTVRCDSRAATVIDTVGAGDAFAAGLLAAHLEGMDLSDAMRFASVVAAEVVGTVGDIEGLPSRIEVERLMRT